MEKFYKCVYVLMVAGGLVGAGLGVYVDIVDRQPWWYCPILVVIYAVIGQLPAVLLFLIGLGAEKLFHFDEHKRDDRSRPKEVSTQIHRRKTRKRE